jgi:RNA polymerase sigma factor (sigma-70 family)
MPRFKPTSLLDQRKRSFLWRAGGGRNDVSHREPCPYGLNRQQRKLAESYMPLAMSIASRWRKPVPSYRDEFIGAAATALCQAARVYDPKRRVKFSAYASLYIKRALWTLSAWIDQTYRPSGDEGAKAFLVPLSPTMEEEGLILNQAQQHEAGVELEARDEVEAMLTFIPPRYAMICRKVYIEGLSRRETAEALKCSKATVDTLHCTAMKMLASVVEYRRSLEGQSLLKLDPERNEVLRNIILGSLPHPSRIQSAEPDRPVSDDVRANHNEE